ncbi:uncharacterized protein VTP21DRAFT_5773 [Calcarisporiella thermophila]|uniref:uncharacterized protein n=1 Tax=Calcarisporiella thermophila TaxID=911321 RepID=UPI0037420F2D
MEDITRDSRESPYIGAHRDRMMDSSVSQSQLMHHSQFTSQLPNRSQYWTSQSNSHFSSVVASNQIPSQNIQSSFGQSSYSSNNSHPNTENVRQSIERQAYRAPPIITREHVLASNRNVPTRTHKRIPSNSSQSSTQTYRTGQFSDFDGVYHTPPLKAPHSQGVFRERSPPGRAQFLSYDRASTLSTQGTTISSRASFETLNSMNRSGRVYGERTHSLSSTSYEMNDRTLTISRLRAPVVYPALLSRVATAFRQRISLNTRLKNSLEYKDCFDGREAVDLLAYIIRTTDRNLALLVGRALDSQKFFHDVTYDHRLRDSVNELYKFKDRAPTLTVPERELLSQVEEEREEEEEGDLPNGVFTLLTDCYSPTCSRDKLCYSIVCPRRLEQQARLNQNIDGNLIRSASRGSNNDSTQDQRLWIHSVPREIADSVSSEERKRQENIFELIYTEKDFVSDLEYVREFWIKPLRVSAVVPEERRELFIREVFFNILEVHAINSRMCDAMQKRQNAYAIVDQIGDILLDHVVNFEPFVRYGAHQVIGKFVFEREKNGNPQFAFFVQEVERLPESRKLELNGYLTKPTTRLARYNLLLDQILKHTPEGHPDRTNIPKAMNIIREFLKRVNVETGRVENRLTLDQLQEQIIFKPGTDYQDLQLHDPNREIIFKGPLNKKSSNTDQSSDLQVFLFDHVLLFTKIKHVQKYEQYKVYKAPIPLELLQVILPDQQNSRRPSSILPSYGRLTPVAASPAQKSETKAGYPITFVSLGSKFGPPLTLYASTHSARCKWVEKIERQRQIIFENTRIFEVKILSERYFPSHNKINCSATCENGMKLVLGTDLGLSVGVTGDMKSFQHVLTLEKVSQIEILEETRIIMVLADKQLYTYPIEVLDAFDTNPANRRGRRISSHVSFFKYGTCLNRNLICVVKSNSLSTTIKALEPQYQPASKKNKSSIGRLLRSGHESLRFYKEFYIPTESTSIHFLKSKLCVGCTKGFEVVDLETLSTQELLDPDNESLAFVHKRENVRPIALYRVRNGEFLLCYDEFAFYVDKNGRHVRHNWIIFWEGIPTAFVYHYPYVLAFETSFIEVWNVNTGIREQVIQGSNIRCLNPEATRQGCIHAVMDDPIGEWQILFSLTLSEKGGMEVGVADTAVAVVSNGKATISSGPEN